MWCVYAAVYVYVYMLNFQNHKKNWILTSLQNPAW